MQRSASPFFSVYSIRGRERRFAAKLAYGRRLADCHTEIADLKKQLNALCGDLQPAIPVGAVARQVTPCGDEAIFGEFSFRPANATHNFDEQFGHMLGRSDVECLPVYAGPSRPVLVSDSPPLTRGTKRECLMAEAAMLRADIATMKAFHERQSECSLFGWIARTGHQAGDEVHWGDWQLKCYSARLDIQDQLMAIQQAGRPLDVRPIYFGIGATADVSLDFSNPAFEV